MKYTILQKAFIVLGASLLINFVFAEGADILMPSQYHGDEVSAKSGEQWLAVIARKPETYELIKSTLRITKVNDPVFDDENMKTGKAITVEGNHNVLFLLKDVPGLQPGPVATAIKNQYLKPNEPLQARMGTGPIYSIELQVEKPDATAEWSDVNCKIIVSDGKKSQTIFTVGGGYNSGEFDGVGDGAEIEVIWAGDLNQDNRLDLLIDLTDDYNVQLPTLFISPSDSSGPLLIRVAQHYSVGC